jgi:hypothetical protein
MTTSADGSQVPFQATSGVHQDTSEEVPTIAPDFTRVTGSAADPGEAIRNPLQAELNKLRTFLMTAYPREMHRAVLTRAESPVDVAIRLLKGLSAIQGGAKCSSEYCNLPVNHDGAHGFVNFQPR